MKIVSPIIAGMCSFLFVITFLASCQKKDTPAAQAKAEAVSAIKAEYDAKAEALEKLKEAEIASLNSNLAANEAAEAEKKAAEAAKPAIKAIPVGVAKPVTNHPAPDKAPFPIVEPVVKNPATAATPTQSEKK